MRALVLYSSSGRLTPIAKGLAGGLERAGYSVQLMEAGQAANSPVSVAQYDLVCVGSPSMGFWGGQIAADIENLLKRVVRMEGKSSVAFVRPGLFGAPRSLRKLMSAMEQQGAWVQDFATLASAAEAERFGKRLQGIVRE